MHRYRPIVSVAAAAAAIGIAAYLSRGPAASTTPAAPDSYTLLDGSRVNLAVLHGKLLLVNF